MDTMRDSPDHFAPSGISAVYRALNKPDILTVIFQFCDPEDRTLASCALVQKAWEEPALRCLWWEMDDARPLFQLMGPLEETGSVVISRPRTQSTSLSFLYLHGH